MGHALSVRRARRAQPPLATLGTLALLPVRLVHLEGTWQMETARVGLARRVNIRARVRQHASLARRVNIRTEVRKHA